MKDKATAKEYATIKERLNQLLELNEKRELKALHAFALQPDEKVTQILYATPIEAMALLTAEHESFSDITKQLYTTLTRDWRGGVFEMLMMQGADPASQGLAEYIQSHGEDSELRQALDAMRCMGYMRLLSRGTVSFDELPDGIRDALKEMGLDKIHLDHLLAGREDSDEALH